MVDPANKARAVDERLVSLLNMLLGMAREGEIASFALIAVHSNGNVHDFKSAEIDLLKLEEGMDNLDAWIVEERTAREGGDEESE